MTVPAVARIADVMVLVLLATWFAVALTGGVQAWPFGVRISITSPWRVLLWAVVVLVLRHAWVRRPSLWQRARDLRLLVDSGEAPAEGRPRPSRSARLRMHGLVILAAVALTCAVAFEQVMHLRSVADLGDPLFSTWRLDWVAYQLRTDPLNLFHANIFHPEPRTLAYSDAILVPALVSAPWLWLGADVVVVHNLLMLATAALSGVTMFWLVRELTDSTGAAAFSGAAFAVYPLRWALYSNLELEVTLWMPLVLLWLHRTIRSGRLRDGIMTGLTFALQALSCFYYALFLAVHAGVVFLWYAIDRGARIRAAIPPLAAGAMLTAMLVTPATIPYFQNRATVGERELGDTAQHSARPRDYLAAHPRSRAYGERLRGEGGRLELFPGVTPVALAAAGIWPPLGPAAAACAAALAVSANASFGVYGATYPLLYRWLLPFRGLRAPQRFGVLVGLSLAVLGGFGVARLLRRVRSASVRAAMATGLIVLVAVESAPALRLTPVWETVPDIYERLAATAVLVDLPFPQRDGSTRGEYSFLYFATSHHRRLVNGGSGFYPRWYDPLSGLMRTFPNDAAMAELKRHGAGYLVVHGYFYDPDEYANVTGALDRRTDVRLVGASSWNGAECRLYAIVPAGDTAPRLPREAVSTRR